MKIIIFRFRVICFGDQHFCPNNSKHLPMDLDLETSQSTNMIKSFTFSEAPSFLQQTNQVEANGKNGESGEVKSNDGRVWLGRLVGLVGFSLNLQQILHGMSSNLGWGHFSKRQNTRIEGGSTHELVKVNPSPSIMTA